MNPEDEYLLLRKRLDALGYRQPLSVEALPLIDTLLCDLITTTNSLKQSKLKNLNSKTSNIATPLSKEQVNSIVGPFKQDNTRLLKENNELNAKIIKSKDEHQNAIKAFKMKQRKLEHENVDLKRLNDTYIKAANDLEKEAKQKTLAIQKLQEKALQTVVELPSKRGVGSNTTNSIRRQRMQIDSELAPGTIQAQLPTTQRQVDLMRLANQRIEQLELDLATIQERNKNLTLDQESFDEKLFLRETEISRLRRELTGGRPEEVVTIEAKCQASDRLIQQLNSQLELTQAANHDLEAIIDETNNKMKSL